jgi:hypothetical protein
MSYQAMNRAQKRKIRKAQRGAPAKGTLPRHPLSQPLDQHGTPRPVRTFADGIANELRLLGGQR